MCFIKKPSIPAPVAVPQQVEPEPVERHQAELQKQSFQQMKSIRVTGKT